MRIPWGQSYYVVMGYRASDGTTLYEGEFVKDTAFPMWTITGFADFVAERARQTNDTLFILSVTSFEIDQ